MRQIVLLWSVIAFSTSALAQAAPSQENGKAVFNKWCLTCHGAKEGAMPLAGTGALMVKYKGQMPAVLEERNNLAPEFIRVVVRGGLFGMPITRKTEVSDAQLEDIIAYLTRNQKR
jgi:mono/diheme cytochrome c family protein